MNKELKKLKREAEKSGWRVERRPSSNHLRWMPPNGGKPVFSGTTPSDYRGFLNLKAAIKRATRKELSSVTS